MNIGVFLDRDGVINEVLSKRVKFVNTPKDFYLLPKVGEAVKKLNDRNLPVFVVTNQGGVGLGFMSENALHSVHKEMEKQLAEYGASVIEVSYCAHKPHEGCECRKPGAKMLIDLAEKHHINLEESYMIGDRDVDILAGKAAGTKTILIGKDPSVQADLQFPSLFEAASYIVETI
ncbi:D-glycero-alpha-D-manno-heptose-1,7-bisphosphate 7-phosphatase [Bacillus suaedaesalsae]|uniref:D,D-heptose 1,7-bisphosphate phosphatase n=1 Tax=Bacillus suaedaesalsae TaxID=2810349 RepID=A0ABS2DIA2_9BACI|nr:HAD family hydrolase [Bacillus suaedaesalsae]MBM6618121.1 HAD family hydrolase [Bacillus suaedaesalsae]